MRIKFILPALTEATSPFFRPIKYSLFPPLGLATLAAHTREDDECVLVDEHVQPHDLFDTDYDVVVIQVYITNAFRSYELADHYRRHGAHVCLGGLHVTSLPDEARPHADTIFTGPGDDSFPRFLEDYRVGEAKPHYDSTVRTLVGTPPVRRDLIRRELYLVPNSIVVTRGCPHHCTFCYKDAFFKGGKGFYTQEVDDALAEIERLPGRHLYFLDDHLLGNKRFARALFEGMRGMNRVFQGAATVDSILRGDLIEQAANAGLRSVFIGFESRNEANLKGTRKAHNVGRDYDAAIARLDDLGIMINGSFVFGLDHDDADVFDRTVDWAVAKGITTATFHVLTPYPGTALYAQMEEQGRLLHHNWDLYDTRHVVYRPKTMNGRQIEAGYWRAYKRFYRIDNITRASLAHARPKHRLKHFAYSIGWKKFEPAWAALIKARQLGRMLPVLESVLSKVGPDVDEVSQGTVANPKGRPTQTRTSRADPRRWPTSSLPSAHQATAHAEGAL